MRSVEFKSRITADGRIDVPPEIASLLPGDAAIQVVVVWGIGDADAALPGLNVASWIRIHKLTVLAKDRVVRNLGQLTEPDRTSLAALLSDAFCPERRK